MKRFISIFISLVMLISLIPGTAFAEDTMHLDIDDNASKEINEMSPEEYALWKQSYISDNTVSLFSTNRASELSENEKYIKNDYIEAYINDSGHYTMGTTGGNPNSSSDNNKLLLYGHPGSTTTQTLIRIDGEDYFFSANDVTFLPDGKTCVSKMTIGDVLITQTISLQHNSYTQRADVAEIKYELKNTSDKTKMLGGRIMLDTMLGNNDGAPFKIPGIGNVTKEVEYIGSSIPQYWQSFDDLNNPTVVSSGTFYRTMEQRPDKVQFADWGEIYGHSWDYSVNKDTEVTGDSAVAVYYNPISVSAGQTRSFSTYYGLSELSGIESVGDINFRLTGDISELNPNEEGTAYTDNPFTLTAYVKNNGSSDRAVRLTLDIPSELELGENQLNSKVLAVPANGEISASWQIWAKPQAVRKSVNYSISVKTADTETTENRTLILPAVDYYDLSGLKLNKSHLTIQKGKTDKLVAYLDTGNAHQAAKKYEVRWSSSNPSVVKVDAEGNVTGLKPGTATIKAVSADYKAYDTCTVTVSRRPTTDLDLWGLSILTYKNMTSHVGKTIGDVFKESTPGDNKGLYKADEKFYNETVTKNEYFRTELGGFEVESTYYDDESGFYASVYLDCNDGIVIAYRGSKVAFDDPDFWADAEFAVCDSLDSQFYEAWYVYNRVSQRYPGKKIVLTGHSLGGALAAFVSIMEDVDAITFNGAQGLIIDLTYYINAYYIDKFNGIDNWKFKNHYNKDDLVGNRNPKLYESLEHRDNGKGTYPSVFAPHDMNTLIKADSNGKISLSNYSTSKNHLYSPWTRTLTAWFGYSGGSLFTSLGINASKLKDGSGRVMLGTKNSNLKTLTAPGNVIEIRENIFFSGGKSTMTGNGGAADTFVFKDSDTMYGKGGNDTYITYETGDFFAEIKDPSGKDKIIFKNMSMDDLSQDVWDNENMYRINTGSGNQVWVSKDRNLFQPEMVVVDKYGKEKKISSLPIRKENGKEKASVLSLRSFDLMLADEHEDIASDPVTVYISGKNIEIDILDSGKNVLGSFDNKTSEVYTEAFAYVYASDEAGSEGIEIELFNEGKYVRIKAGNSINVTSYKGEAGTPGFKAYTFDAEVNENKKVLINGLLDGGNNFVYEENGSETSISSAELKKVSSITPIVSEKAIENIEMYSGETVDIELVFEPENIAIDDVKIELADDNNAVSVSVSEDVIYVKGNSAGENTLKITALDGSGVSVSVPITVKQDLLGKVTLTADGESYTEGEWSDCPVEISAEIPNGYDEIIFGAEGNICGREDGKFTVDSEGVIQVSLYAKDNSSGKVTESKTVEVKIDLEDPAFIGAEDEGEYYIDKLIYVNDINLKKAEVNDVEFTEDEYAKGKLVSETGIYKFHAKDLSGKASEIEFEIKELPEADDLTVNDEELVVSIRNEFEDVKYDLSETRRDFLDAYIYELEMRILYLKNSNSSENAILSFSIDGQIGEADINDTLSTIYLNVSSKAFSSDKTAVIAISEGASISPKPYEAQDFSEDVVYTVTAANGDEREWTVSAGYPEDDTAPNIIGATAVGNIITLEFDDYIGDIINESGFELSKKNRAVRSNAIEEISSLNNVVNIEFESNFNEMEEGEYSLLIKSGSLSNVSNVENEDLEYEFTLGSIVSVSCPAANKTGEVAKGTQVTLTTETEGADIYYTLDGKEPDRNSLLYTSPITIDSSLTLKAIAVKDGMEDSSVLVVEYTVKSSGGGGGGGGGGGASYNKALVPTTNNPNKEVLKGTAIELSCGAEGAKIYYTTDGSTPTSASKLYEEPIIITEDTVIKMIAVKEGMSKSSVVTISYKIRNPKIEIKENADKISYMAARQNGAFMPDEPATRYEIIAALYNLFNIEKIDTEKVFKDVDYKNKDLVSIFSGASIIAGYPDGTFRGDRGITRAEFVRILTVMLGIDETAEGETGLKDIEGHWAEDDIVKFFNKGYIHGYPDGTFKPDKNITRAEAVTIINNIINAAEKESTVSDDVNEAHWAYSEIKKAILNS